MLDKNVGVGVKLGMINPIKPRRSRTIVPNEVWDTVDFSRPQKLIAAELNVDLSTVYAVAKRRGVKNQRKARTLISQETWDKVDFSRPQKLIAAELNVSVSTVCVESRRRGNRIYAKEKQKMVSAIDLLKEVDIDNQRVVAIMKSSGKNIPPKMLDLIDRIHSLVQAEEKKKRSREIKMACKM